MVIRTTKDRVYYLIHTSEHDEQRNLESLEPENRNAGSSKIRPTTSYIFQFILNVYE